MAIKFKGDTTVAIINSIKKAEVDTVYRCFDSGVLLSNEIINHGDFVSWDGTKWIKRSDLAYLINNAAEPIPQQIDDIKAVIPSSASSANKLVTESDVTEMEEMLLADLPIADKTLRFKFSKNDYDPTVAGVGSGGTWKKVSAKFNNVWDWTVNGTSFLQTFTSAFASSDNLVSVISAGDTSAVTDMYKMFHECSSLTKICLFDTSAVTDLAHAFRGCTSLTSVPLFDTSAVTDMYETFRGCTSLTSVPLFDTSAVTDMEEAFRGCTKVEGGALALYQQLSTQATPPSSHDKTFTACGRDTATGAAELAQIPKSWGGTLQEP